MSDSHIHDQKRSGTRRENVAMLAVGLIAGCIGTALGVVLYSMPASPPPGEAWPLPPHRVGAVLVVFAFINLVGAAYFARALRTRRNRC